MQVSVEEAKEKLAELIGGLADREFVTITKDGQPVAQLTGISPKPEAAPKREVVFGGMRDIVTLYPGWDEKLDWKELLGDDF